MSTGSPVRPIFTVIMNLLVVVAVALTTRLVVLFFGQLSSRWWGETIVAITNPATLPLGFDPIKTPYGGVFDIAAAATVILLLVAEWILSVFRARA